MKQFILILSLSIVICASNVTTFNDIKPQVIERNTYSKSSILGVKNYKIGLYEDLRYSVYTSLMGVTQIIFPKGMRIKSHKSGMEEYFQVSPANSQLTTHSQRYLFVRPVIPKSMPASLNEKIQKNNRLLDGTSTQLHIILENQQGEDMFVRMHLQISSKQHENETIEIVLPNPTNDELVDLRQTKQSLFDHMLLQKRLQFNHFKLFRVSKTKSFNQHTQFFLDTISASDEYIYYNGKLTGNGLFPLKLSDIKLHIAYYKQGLFWENTYQEGTLTADFWVVYPEPHDPHIPNQSLDHTPKTAFQRYVTFAFKKGQNTRPFFYSTLNIKNGSLVFENKVRLKKSQDRYHEFISDTAI